MGSYLSTPITEKHTDTGVHLHSDIKLTYCVSEMQGWRKDMEDAHITEPDIGTDSAFFAVFDGHGGSEVATFCAKHMTDELKKLPEYVNGDYEKALTSINHHLDDLIQGESAEDGVGVGAGQEANDDDADEMEEEFVSRSRSAEDLATLEAEVRISKAEAVEVMMKLMALQRGRQDGKGEQSCDLVNAGCTSVVTLIRGRDLYVANAGDSRVELNRIKKAGGFVTDQGRVNGNLNLSRCIGDLKYKIDKSIPASEQIITAEPDILKFKITDEDEFIILGCDGIWDCKTNQEAVDFVRPRLQSGVPLEEVTEELLDSIICKDPSSTGGIGADNMTFMIIKIDKVVK
eukprot:GSMAST32.ASY1.ANO1.2154.1 assembled CDS